MANYVYPFIALTGGVTGALDAIDGTALADLDMAYGSVAGVTYNYLLDVDSAAAEASPGIIAPDANGGDKRWILQNAYGGEITRSARTSNTILGAADSGTFIDVTSGTFTQTFTAAATLGSGWWCYYRNSGTGDVTLDPDASETIDGLTSFVMYPGEKRMIVCTGTAFISTAESSFYREFTGTGTFTKPPGYSAFDIECMGAGGGGGSGRRDAANSQRCGGGGGGGGAYERRIVLASAIGVTETVTIGAGGTGGTAITVDTTDGNAGTAGGTSSFGALITVAGGGLGGGGTGAAGVGGTGGSVINVTGFSGGSQGVASGFGGGGGGSAAGISGGTGGDSAFGGGGGASGGGISNVNTSYNGGTGGISWETTGGTAGTQPSGAGGTGAANAGGGGGGAGGAGAGGTGGDGTVAGGGGGGGASLNTNNSGAGGAGGDGICRIWGIL